MVDWNPGFDEEARNLAITRSANCGHRGSNSFQIAPMYFDADLCAGWRVRRVVGQVRKLTVAYGDLTDWLLSECAGCFYRSWVHRRNVACVLCGEGRGRKKCGEQRAHSEICAWTRTGAKNTSVRHHRQGRRNSAVRVVAPAQGLDGPDSAIVDRNVLACRNACVHLSRAGDSGVLLEHLLPVRKPTNGAWNGEQNGEHL